MTELQKIAIKRNALKFRLMALQGLFKSNLSNEPLTDIEKLRFEECRKELHQLLLYWNLESFKLNLHPKPLYIIYDDKGNEFIRTKRLTEFNYYIHSDCREFTFKVFKTKEDFENLINSI